MRFSRVLRGHVAKKRPFDVSIVRRSRLRVVAGILALVTVGGTLYGYTTTTRADAINSTDFVTTWKTDNPGVSNASSITIPIAAWLTYNYSVDWNNDGIVDQTGITDSVTHDFGTPGTYKIRISGTFPSIFFQGSGDVQKILEVNQWGAIHWGTMQNAFMGASNLIISATDSPDLSSVIDMSGMFYEASSMNQDINDWDTSNVQYMNAMFAYATTFNQPLGNWNTGNVTDMSSMFSDASSFNQNIGAWNTGQVMSMSSMFGFAIAFNNGGSDSINNWDTSSVTDSGWMFMFASTFNQPIGGWNVSGITYMPGMFCNASAFNQSLASWNTGSVTSMGSMFQAAISFNQPVGAWDTSNVQDMWNMFDGAAIFNQPLNTWDTSKVESMSSMFSQADSFNQQLNGWDTSNVIDMRSMFYGATSFNQSLSNWDTSKVTNMSWMFSFATSFNQPLDTWNIGLVTNLSYMFYLSSVFDQPVGAWDTSKVTSMKSMFEGAPMFNHSLAGWDTSNVIDMDSMFSGAVSFNQPLNTWNTSKVTLMGAMFNNARAFDQPLDHWDTSKVTSMSYMFAGDYSYNNAFNQPLNTWDTSKVTSMSYMFYNAKSFDQSLASWNVVAVTTMNTMFSNSAMSGSHYDATLIGWAAQGLKANVTLGAAGRTYCAAQTARQSIITNYSWSITGDTLSCVPPSAPRNLSATPSQGVIALNWMPPLSNGGGSFVGYTVQYKFSSSSIWTSQPTAQLTYDVTGLDPGVSYDFRILAVSTHGSSPASNVATAILTDPVTRTFDASILGSAETDVVSKAVLAVTSATCYQIDAPSFSILGPNGVTAPQGVTILGGLSYNVTCVSTGGSTAARIDLGSYYDDTSKLRIYKKSATTGLEDITSHVAVGNSVEGVTPVTTVGYTLVDGGPFDEDSTVNGTIVDPVYIGILTTNSSSNSSGSSATLADTGEDVGTIASAAIAAILSGFWVLYRKLA